VNRITAQIQEMTVEELEGVRRVCASLVRTIDMLLEIADDRTSSEPAESLAG
jgi:hypothetical protein